MDKTIKVIVKGDWAWDGKMFHAGDEAEMSEAFYNQLKAQFPDGYELKKEKSVKAEDKIDG
jgi:hypothetical protein